MLFDVASSDCDEVKEEVVLFVGSCVDHADFIEKLLDNNDPSPIVSVAFEFFSDSQHTDIEVIVALLKILSVACSLLENWRRPVSNPDLLEKIDNLQVRPSHIRPYSL